MGCIVLPAYDSPRNAPPRNDAYWAFIAMLALLTAVAVLAALACSDKGKLADDPEPVVLPAPPKPDVPKLPAVRLECPRCHFRFTKGTGDLPTGDLPEAPRRMQDAPQ